MGLYSAPLAYTGYHPDVTGPPTVVNSTVRAATQEEVNAGQLDHVYVSPATLSSGIVTDLSSPPPIGDVTPNTIDGTFINGNYFSCNILTCRNQVELAFGSTASEVSIGDCFNTIPLDVTILCGTGSFGNCTLKMANNPLTTTIDLGNTTTLGSPRTTTINGGAQTQNDTLRLMFGAHSGGTQALNIFSGACITPSSQVINIFSAASTSTQTFNLFASTTANSTVNICTGFAASTLNLGNGNVASSVNVGNLYFSNATSVSGATVIINSQRSGQCVFSDIITAGSTVNLTLSSSFINSGSVFIASVSCADTSPAVLLSITRINPSAGAVAFRVTNAGASDTATPISINFLQII